MTGFQTVRVGTVGTPVGTITLSCAYRINLAFMSTRQFERTPPIMGIIIDHFVDRPYPSSSPMHPCNYRAGEDNGAVYPSVEDSQEVCTTSFSTSPPSQVRETRLFLLLDRTIAVRIVCIFLHQLLCKQKSFCC